MKKKKCHGILYSQLFVQLLSLIMDEILDSTKKVIIVVVIHTTENKY